tara:strand:- start:712 stop:969 length:258 start_codon:yes stop_codon:yes gene_type:complete
MFSAKDSDHLSSENKKTATLDFEGKKYDINSLPDEIKEIIKVLQVSDTQIRMHKDTLRLLEISRNTLGVQLKQKLKNISELENKN